MSRIQLQIANARLLKKPSIPNSARSTKAPSANSSSLATPCFQQAQDQVSQQTDLFRALFHSSSETQTHSNTFTKRDSIGSARTYKKGLRKSTIDDKKTDIRGTKTYQKCQKRINKLTLKTLIDQLPFSHKKGLRKPEKGKSLLLTQQLTRHVKKTSNQDLQIQVCQVWRLREMIEKYTCFNPIDISSLFCSVGMKWVNKDAEIWNYQMVKKFDGSLSKLLYYMCLEIYCLKECKGTTLQFLILINKNIQYCSRRMNFMKVALKTCFDIAELYCGLKQYEMAEEYYSRCLKLAVYINDKFYEEKAIDKMGLCAYYRRSVGEADYYHRNIHNLCPVSVQIIKQHYSNDQEIQRLLKEKYMVGCSIMSHKDSFQQDYYNFGESNKIRDLPQENLKNIEKDLNRMTRITALRTKIPMILKAQQKLKMVGFKKYHGNCYVELKRTKFLIRHSNNDQILLSHSSNSRISNGWEKKRIDKECRAIVGLINSLTSGELRWYFTRKE